LEFRLQAVLVFCQYEDRLKAGLQQSSLAMIAVEDALKIVLEHARPVGGVETSLSHSLLGQVLSEDVATDIDSPPFTKSMMDGYAIRTADTQRGLVELTVIEEVQAGGMPTKAVKPVEAIAIYTGAPIPEGADAVVMKERCERFSTDRVRVNDPSLQPGKNVLPRGAEMRVGDVVIPAGTPLTPAAFGLLAAVGRTKVSIRPHITVGVLATGDELVEAGVVPTGSQIRNSNAPMLCAQAHHAGAKAENLGIARDVEAELEGKVRSGLHHDILLLAGGVSAGKYDFVPAVLASLGVQTHFHHVRMKPGKPLLFGTLGSKLIFGLPGNPVSAFLGFELFVRPAIRTLMGHPQVHNQRLQLMLTKDLKANHDRPTYHPAKLAGNAVEPLPWFGSADLRSLLRVDAFIELPAGPVNYSAGDTVPVLAIG
jgi:molybdopterin molybdotransferase